jgi:hypothetical protein
LHQNDGNDYAQLVNATYQASDDNGYGELKNAKLVNATKHGALAVSDAME